MICQILLSNEILEQSLSCEPVEDSCMTVGGNDFPAKCKTPFIDEGRNYFACTDVNSPDPSRYCFYFRPDRIIYVSVNLMGNIKAKCLPYLCQHQEDQPT